MLSRELKIKQVEVVTGRALNSTKIFLGAKEQMCGTLSIKAAFCRPLRCKVLQSFSLSVLKLLFLFSLGIVDASKQPAYL